MESSPAQRGERDRRMNETKSPGAICASWWHRSVGNDDGAARMTRARLHAQLRAAGYHPGADRLALVAIVLAHVAESGSRKLAETFGQSGSKDGPRALGALRFQTLVRTTGYADLITPLRRAMAIVRQTPIDIVALASDLYRWNEDTRTAWCFQYFGASASVPEQTLEETEA